MDSINGIPFRWDAVEDNALLGGLLSNGTGQLGSLQGVAVNSGAGSLFEDSPFGEDWDIVQVVPDSGISESLFDQYPDPQKPSEDKIIYNTFFDTDGVQLIEAYKKDILYRKTGSFADKERDINIYYEDESKSNEFGGICFVRFNEAAKNYFAKYSNTAGWFADEVVEQHAAGKGGTKAPVSLNAEKIKAAIAFELDYGGGGIDIFRKIALRLLHKLAENIREMKYTEKNWNFDRKDYDPIIGSEILRGIVNKWKSFEEKAYSFIKKCYNTAEWCRNYIPYTGDFLAEIIYGIIDFITSILESIDKFFQYIDAFNKFVAVINAFICGVINEAIEVAAGLMDLLALLVTLTDKSEHQLLEESFENMLDAIKKDPEKILDKLQKAWDDTKERYSDDKNRYAKAYNAGEDLVDVILFVGLIVGVVRFIKNIPKLLKNLKKWITEKGKRLVKAPVNTITKEIVELSKKIAESVKNKIAVQNSSNLDELYKAAKAANKELEKITKKFAAETGGEPGIRSKSIEDGLKAKERAIEKVDGEYKGKAEYLLDIAGSKVVYETTADLYRSLEKFANKFEIVRFKDRIIKPLENGYRDILMNIKMKNGHIVEFRLHLKAMDEAAQAGHDLYKQRRTLEILAKKRDLTKDEAKKMYFFIKKESELYLNAWEKIINN
jgi:Region found in RelA / SpoT proteins